MDLPVVRAICCHGLLPGPLTYDKTPGTIICAQALSNRDKLCRSSTRAAGLHRCGLSSQANQSMAPVKVFGSAVFANAARVMACLEEVGVEYEVVEVDYMAREHKGLKHLARNPFGQIPAFQDGDIMLFESRAISKYVLRKYAKSAQDDLLREGNPEEAAMVDAWTEVEAHHYFPAMAPIFYECVVYPARLGTVPDQKIVGESLEKLRKVLDVYEAHLSRTKSKYLAGNFFSFADLNHFPFTFHIMTATPHASLFDSYPHIKAWWARVMARPSLKKISTHMEIKP